MAFKRCEDDEDDEDDENDEVDGNEKPTKC